MSWLVPAMYSQQGDCRAIEPVAENGHGAVDSMYRRILIQQLGKSREEADALMASFALMDLGLPVTQLLINRGRLNGRPVNVYQNPESYPDPGISKVTGPYAIGFNLDGRGAGSPGSFEDPYTHEQGVDNQFFRVIGCIRSARVVAPEQPSHWIDVWLPHADRSPAWLISITGRNLSQDGEVTVTFDTAIERMRLDAQGQGRRDMTFRVDPNPRTHAVLRGRIRDGVITVEPGPLNLAVKSIVMPFDMADTHLRLKIKPDGALEGILGGYQTWKPIYHSFYGVAGFNNERNFGMDIPGVYYGMKQLADADPDPATGQNRRISITYAIQAVPAFVAPAAMPAVTTASSKERSRQGSARKSESTGQSATAPEEPESSGGPATPRRLTAAQYRHAIIDVFGKAAAVSGRFEPDARAGPVGGLAAVGAGRVSVSATGFEQYHATARAIAAKVVDEKNRELLLPCRPKAAAVADDACARTFLSAVGRLLYRRPLTTRELEAYVNMAADAARSLRSFHAGIEMSLAGMLQSLPFIFREEAAEPDPARPGGYRLDAFSKASRLSFLLWDAAPDPQLLAAADSGDIHTAKGLAREVDRLLASARFEDGVRAFFTDMLRLDELALISKDSLIYPKYTAEVARDALEQTLRTITDHVIARRGDYRDLFTTRKTFLTPLLGSVYGVPVKTDAALGEQDVWQPYEYPQGDPRAGILTQVSFVSLHSHPGRTSPTLRGKALREIMFCEKVPDPPPNVNLNLEETAGHGFLTMRQKLAAHATQPMCAGCHKITDPMGLALENFDSAGGYRATDNGAPIDTTGTFGGKKFSDSAGLLQAVRDYPGACSCLVDKLYAYAVGRTAAPGEAAWLDYLKKRFAERGYRIPDLLRLLATSDAFYRVTPPQQVAAKTAGSKPAWETRP